MNGLRISDKLSLPLESALWRFGFLAISGAGKTYDACVLAEEFVKNGIPIVALDSLGIWWGLRVGVEGHEGLPIVIFGGEHHDIPIPVKPGKDKRPIVDEDRVKELVKAVLQSGISCVLDTSEFSKSQQRRIVGIFAEELVRLNKDYGMRHVFIEEADNWVPQRSSGEGAFVAGAVNDLCRRGGNFNIGSSLISQRAAVVNKDVLTQITCMIALRILASHDKNAVRTWIESVAGSNDSTDKFVDSLKGLKDGEAWVWHPGEPEIFKRVQFRKRETLHATREYFLQSKLDKAALEPMEVGTFIDKFRAKFEPKKEAPKQIEIPKPIAPPPLASYVTPEKLANLSAWQQEPQKTYFQERADEQSVKVLNQSLPNLEIRQYKPNLAYSVELPNEPSDILGKIAVILKTQAPPSKRNDRWNPKIIRERIERHEWDAGGVEDGIAQLVRWEILTPINQYLRFDPSRVTVKEVS